MLWILLSVSLHCCQLTLISSVPPPNAPLTISTNCCSHHLIFSTFLFYFFTTFTIMFPVLLSLILLKTWSFPSLLPLSPLPGAGLVCRYTAVVKPVQYQYSTGQSSCRRVSLMIVIVWMLAFAVSCPLLFGFNTTGDPSVCSISNPSFVIYSSLVSFYLPFMVTLLLYVRIYLVLRQRQKKRTLTRQGSQSASAKPCYAHQEHMERKVLPNRRQGVFSPCLSLKCTGQEMSTKRRLLTVFSLQRYRSFCHEASLTKAPGTTQTSRWEERRRSTKPAVEVRRLSNGRTISSLRLAQQQPRLIQLRERKATQMLAIVLGAFIVCWLPFFLIHILNAHCPSCHVPPGLYSASTWLGYVNSALNPIIYTTFNTDFRKAFLKILCC
uniref:D(3) dopamine receptor n=1 Tax=Taeniopygia guttata TaxID=59729 RepID=A0A674GWJ3_TAEGU|nr:D(3) dopamine receptor isoform X4 [Taeniopygia guttata]